MILPHPKTFHYEEAEGVAVVRLNRPERLNALTFESYGELAGAFAELQTRAGVRSVLLTGTGRAFCSGGDVEDIIGPLLQMDAEELLEFTRQTGRLILNMRQLRRPIVAALNGTTCGAGAVMAIACDFRIAAKDARIAFLFTRVGLSGADMGAAWLLPRIVGASRASDLLLRGRFVPAEEALAIGLYHQVVEKDQVVAVARALAKELAEGPTLGVPMTKEMLNREASMSLEQAIEAEAQAQALCMRHPDFREAYQAFVEKRTPRFLRDRSS